MSANQFPPLPPGWTEHVAPTGHKYYYNAGLKKSTYKRPTTETTEVTQPPQDAPRPTELPLINNIVTVTTKEKVIPLTEWNAEISVESREEPEVQEAARTMTDEVWKKLEDRPRKRTVIPGAEPWVQVTTKWHRNFYHNPETNESYWKIPPVIRDVVEAWQLESARADLAQSESEEEESGHEDGHPDVKPEDLPVEFAEEDIAYQLEMMQAEYGGIEEMQQEEELDDFSKRQIFISLLEDKEINPFNTWESEMPKMVQDPRYAIVRNTKQRMDIFAEWARARIALIKEEKEKEVKEDPKVSYLKLLAEKGDPKEYWFEFRRKYRKTLEYKHYGTEKQKEELWRDWFARKKMSRETREAELLSWMRGVKGPNELVLQKLREDVRYWVLGDEKDDIVRDALRGRL